MGAALEITSALPQAVVLQRLAAFGKDWRESKLPESVRRRGTFGCAIVVSGETFKLELEPQRRGPNLVWQGTVVPRGDDRGSSIRVRWRLTRFNLLSYALFLLVLLWVFWLHGLALTLILGPILVGAAVTGAFWQADAQEPLCREILDHVVGSTAAAPTTPPRAPSFNTETGSAQGTTGRP